MRKLFFTLLVLPFLATGTVQAQNAQEILKKMDDIMFSASDRQGEITITLESKSGRGKIQVAEMYQKGTDKKLYRYIEPENQAGITTLSLPDDVIWLYMPALGKPRRISLLAKSQAFNNTDFSYEDMATTPFSERFTPRLIETNASGHLLELTPLSDKSNYGKLLVTVNKEVGYPEKMDFYATDGELIKTADYNYVKSGKYWYPEIILMTDLKKEHSTKIELSKMKFDQGLDDSLFEVENMAPDQPETEDGDN